MYGLNLREIELPEFSIQELLKEGRITITKHIRPVAGCFDEKWKDKNFKRKILKYRKTEKYKQQQSNKMKKVWMRKSSCKRKLALIKRNDIMNSKKSFKRKMLKIMGKKVKANGIIYLSRAHYARAFGHTQRWVDIRLKNDDAKLI